MVKDMACLLLLESRIIPCAISDACLLIASCDMTLLPTTFLCGPFLVEKGTSLQ